MARRIASPNLQLPWSSADQDNGALRFWFLIVFIPFLVICVAVTLIDVPEKAREELERLPPELAQIILEPEPVEPPPPPEEEEPEEKEKDEPKDEPKEEPKEEEPIEEPEPIPETVKLVEAKEAAEAEINQIQDDLADLRQDFADLADLSSDDLTLGEGEAEEVDRAVIGASATSKSAGVNTAGLTRNVGSTAVSGKKSTQVKSKIVTATGVGDKGIKEEVVRDKTRRSEEEIRAIIDKNKARIYTVYNRALRDNPALQGNVVFKIVISPSGKVSSVNVVSSELDDPALEKKLLSRMRGINFGVRDVLETTVNYTLAFLPN